MHVLHVSSELHPFSKTGGLADMVASLGRVLAARGARVSVVTPLYRSARGKAAAARDLGWPMDLKVGGRWEAARFLALETAPGVTVYFLDAPALFDRAGLYGEARVDYPDNAMRYAMLCRAALNLARYLPDPPQVVHSHDWQAGLMPLMIREARNAEGWAEAPATILTVHNLAYAGRFPLSDWAWTNLPDRYLAPGGAEFWGTCSYLKAGLVYAGLLSTVSPNYAGEITTEEYGCGMEGVLNVRRKELSGILNGVDYSEWNTTSNPFLKFPYDAEDLTGKRANKAALQAEVGLPVRDDVPLFANISRLEEQKGSDYLATCLEEMLREGMQFVLLGTGDGLLEERYRALQRRHPEQVAALIRFDAALAHRIEAGADFFVMPSRFEPCGLNQLYSLRYGAIPIVRDTGGLHDSVVDAREDVATATGIKFSHATADALGHAMRKALALWASPPALAHFRSNGMRADFSWERSAAEYEALYQRALETRSRIAF